MQKADKGELSNLKNELLVEQVQEQICQYILDTPIAVGAKLPNESKLGDRLDMEKSTIRKAVKLLIPRGILEVRRGFGAYMVSITLVDMNPLGLGAVKDEVALALDSVNVRIILEPGTVKVVVLNATGKGVERLRGLCDSVERKVKVEGSYIEDNTAFYTCMVECSKDKVVEQLIPIIDTAVLMFVNVTHKELTDETIMTYRAVTDAIVEHDPISVKTAMMVHMAFNRNIIKQLMRDGHEAQDWVYW